MTEINQKVIDSNNVKNTKKKESKRRKHPIYRSYIKRVLDVVMSLAALLFLLPLFVVLSIAGAIFMKGNPFFVQKRPGKDEKIFSLIKFRTMSNARAEDGSLLPDSQRLNKYGRCLRSTSIDELPELINILKGDLSIVGPRPLSVMYLPYYTDAERHRHDVRPGLTGLAQISGRNVTTWEQRFFYDLEYIRNITFINDVKIILKTVKKVISRSDIGSRQEPGNSEGLIDLDVYRSTSTVE